VPYEDFLSLQRRLIYEVGGQLDGRITVLLCEHPELITVGRLGSRGHIRLSGEQLRSRRLDFRWVGRGGGCLLHGPGQIAAYPIVPLSWHGWSVGEYLGRLQQAICGMCDQLAVRYELRDQQPGLWGRSGQLACWAVAVRRWITCHGAFINVNPMMTHYAFVDVVDPVSASRGQKTTMGSLFAERRQAMTIPKVRATLIPHLAAAFGTERYHLVTGHPLLKRTRRTRIEARNRAS
jgi:lipoyl(octanoyl) transferase